MLPLNYIDDHSDNAHTTIQINKAKVINFGSDKLINLKLLLYFIELVILYHRAVQHILKTYIAYSEYSLYCFKVCATLWVQERK